MKPTQGGYRGERGGLQDNGNKSEELAIASELLAVVNLFPPSQPIVDPLVIPKRCSLLPVKQMIRNLLTRTRRRRRFRQSIELN